MIRHVHFPHQNHISQPLEGCGVSTVRRYSRREYLAILKYVRDGKFVRGEDGIYRGPHGMNHGQEDHDVSSPRKDDAMAIYTPCLGEKDDGLCGCDKPATTEVQVGWHNASYPGQPFGGQYEEMCEGCYAETDEAQAHSELRRDTVGIRSGFRCDPALDPARREGFNFLS